MVSSQKQVPLGLETISVTYLAREGVHMEQGGDGDGVGSHGDDGHVKEYKPNDPNDTMWIESRPASVLCEEADAGLVGVPLSPTLPLPPPLPVAWRPDVRNDGWI